MRIDKKIARKIVEEWNNTFRHTIKMPLSDKQVEINMIGLFRGALEDQGISAQYLIDKNVEPEIVQFTTKDGLTLAGLVYRNTASNNWIVGLHGFSSSKESMSNMIWIYRKLGYNLIAFDFRNHGGSDKKQVTFGIAEQLDLIACLSYLKKHYKIGHIGLVGASTGGFTINYFALTQKKLIKKYRIKFGITDSSYIAIERMLTSLSISKWPLLKKMVSDVISDIKEIYRDEFDVYLAKGDCELLFERCKKTFPILFLHGKQDSVIEWQIAPEFREKRQHIKKRGQDEVVVFPTGEHVRTFVVHTASYTAHAYSFIQRVVLRRGGKK